MFKSLPQCDKDMTFFIGPQSSPRSSFTPPHPPTKTHSLSLSHQHAVVLQCVPSPSAPSADLSSRSDKGPAKQTRRGEWPLVFFLLYCLVMHRSSLPCRDGAHMCAQIHTGVDFFFSLIFLVSSSPIRWKIMTFLCSYTSVVY